MSAFQLERRSRPGRAVRAGFSTGGARSWLALGLGTVVTLLALRGMVPAGAGVYYDDGVYLALARSLAEGEGYVYANLPGGIPGVKYPPLYPATLAAAWKLAPEYPQNLDLLKGLNALFLGLAAAFSFTAFAAAWGDGNGDRPDDGIGRPDVVIPDTGAAPVTGAAVALGVFATAALLGWGSAPAMVLATALLSEPLFLALGFLALLASSRRRAHPTLTGLLAAAAFLTRGIGIAVLAAVAAAELLRGGTRLRRRARRLALLALGALPPIAGWIAWSAARAEAVPNVLAGQYGSYGAWYAAGDAGLPSGVLPRLREIAVAHWQPFLSNLEMLWIPDAAETTANFVLAVLAVVVLFGAARIGRRSPALALFPFFYLLIVLAWPYEPDRFVYAILPALTLLLAAGGLSLAERIRADLPRWGGPAVALVAGVLFLNSAIYEVQAHARRAWSVFQAAPAAAYEPLNAWIRENTAPDAVIASGLDPYVYWQTGRDAVPSFRFLATDYGRYDVSAETLAGDLDRVLAATGARWVAVIRGEGKAGDTMAAFAEIHPQRARLAHESEAAGVTGEVWEVLPRDESFRGTAPAP